MNDIFTTPRAVVLLLLLKEHSEVYAFEISAYIRNLLATHTFRHCYQQQRQQTGNGKMQENQGFAVLLLMLRVKTLFIIYYFLL